MKRLGIFISFISLALVFSGCNNFLSEPGGGSTGTDDSGLVRVTGTINYDSNLGQIVDTFNNQENPDGRAISNTSGKTAKTFVRATASGKADVDADVTGNSYSLELTPGSWTITCHVFLVASTDTVTFDSDSYVFEGTKGITVSTSGSTNGDVQMGIRTGEVTVPFNFTVYANTNITKYTITLDNTINLVSLADSSSTINYSGGSYRTITLNAGNVSTGRNTFLIAFYDSNNNRIYTIQDSLYVLYGIEEIVYTDNSEGYITSGNIVITSTVIQNRFTNKIFYVDSSVSNDTDRIGTYFDPLGSIQKAVTLIDSVNDGTSQYEIRLNTDFTDNSTTSYSSTNMDSSYICLKGLKKSLKLKICSKDDTKKTIDVNRNSSRTGRVISAWNVSTTNTLELSLENLILKGGCMSNGDGGALVIDRGKLTVNNCEFIGNSAANSGGAINVGDNLSTGSEIKKYYI